MDRRKARINGWQAATAVLAVVIAALLISGRINSTQSPGTSPALQAHTEPEGRGGGPNAESENQHETVAPDHAASGQLRAVNWDEGYQPHCPFCNAIIALGFDTCGSCGKSFEKAERPCPKCSQSGTVACTQKNAGEALDRHLRFGHYQPLGGKVCEGTGMTRGDRCRTCDGKGVLSFSTDPKTGETNFGAMGVYRPPAKRSIGKVVKRERRPHPIHFSGVLVWIDYECRDCNRKGRIPARCPTCEGSGTVPCYICGADGTLG